MEANWCREFTLGKLKSPGTFSVVKIIETDVTEQKHEVVIEFDSQNGFGALLRSKSYCTYKRDSTGVMQFREDESFIRDGNE